MKTLALDPEQLLKPVQWEATGRSPANSPQAVIQAAMALAPFAMNPMAGIDVYELVNAIVSNGPLANSKVQIKKEDMLGNVAPMGLPGNPGGIGPNAPVPGGAMPPGLPLGPDAGAGVEMPGPPSEF